MRTVQQRAYVNNYPEFSEFLHEHECRCQWQVPVGRNPEDPEAFIEQWIAPGDTAAFIIEVRADRRGWDVYTPCRDTRIDATLADLKARIGLK